MPRTSSHASRLLALAGRKAVVRAKDLAARGIHTSALTRLERAGEIERVGPGRYRRAGADRVTEHHAKMLAATSVPGSAVCLLSALEFHVVGTQLPRAVWLAVPRGRHVPRIPYPPLRIVRVAPPLLDIGVETHHIEGMDVRVTGVERTLVDCFRFRNSLVGLDVALEALSDARRQRRLDINTLDKIATQLRVWRVIQPYLMAMLA